MANIFKKHAISVPLVLNGCISSLVLALSFSPTLSTFTASIAATANSAGAGTIVMQEKDSTGTVTCLSTDEGGVSSNTASCPGINRYGGSVGMRPGESAVVVTYIQNVGTAAASSFSLTPGPCTQSATGAVSGTATDFCSRIAVSIMSGPTTIFTGTAAALGGTGAIDVLSRLGLPKYQSGLQVTFTVTTKVDAGVDNSYQGLKVTQPMTWTFGA